MNLHAPFLLLLVLLTASFSYGQAEQDSIILLNGRVYLGAIISTDNQLVTFTEKDKKGNVLNSQIEEYRIFSYTRNNKETVLYTQNDEMDNFLTITEARNTTLGSYDARQTFKPRFVFWSSVAVGYGARLWDTYLLQKTIDNKDYIGSETTGVFFKSRPSLFPVLAPLLLSVTWSIPSFRIKPEQMIQKHLLNDDSYYRGFHRIAKQKRMLAALTGSVIGIGAGLITYGVFKP